MIAMVYDLTRRETFLSLREWIAEIKEILGHLPPTLLIGNKLDRAGERQVTAADITALMESEDILQTAEVSAKTGEGIETLFEAQIRDLVGPGSLVTDPVPTVTPATLTIVPTTQPSKVSRCGCV